MPLYLVLCCVTQWQRMMERLHAHNSQATKIQSFSRQLAAMKRADRTWAAEQQRAKDANRAKLERAHAANVKAMQVCGLPPPLVVVLL